MGTILTMPSFHTSDDRMFVSEEDARRHERLLEYSELIGRGPEQNPYFSKLDKEMLLKYLERNGQEIGKIANKTFRPEVASKEAAQVAVARLATAVLGTDKTRPLPLAFAKKAEGIIERADAAAVPYIFNGGINSKGEPAAYTEEELTRKALAGLDDIP